jgi:hypothetical protein
MITKPTGFTPWIEKEGEAIRVRNASGVTLYTGAQVYIVSYNAADGVMTVDKAKADSLATAADLTICETIANGKVGWAASQGVIRDYNTAGISGTPAVGDLLYLSAATAGAFSKTATVTAASIRQAIGVITKVHATTGRIMTFSGRKVIQILGTSALRDGSVTAGKIDAGALASYQWADVADGTIPAYRLVKLDGSGNLVVGTVGSLDIFAANADNAQRTAAQAINLIAGKTSLIAAEPMPVGAPGIKCGDNGRAVLLNSRDKYAGTIKVSSAGAAFTNQPADDGVTLVSSNAGDTTQTATIIGTTTGGVVVVVEAIALNGVTPVNTVKTNWGVILAVKLSASCAGTVTVKETSGGLTITTLTTGVLSKGVDLVTATAQGAHNTLPSATGSDTTTKTVGIQYTQNDGTTVAYQAVALTNTTPAPFATVALLVTETYTGDLEAARTMTVKTSATEDDENACVGKALLAAAAAAGGTISALVLP